jgi:aryl-alcohol dehydrogenase-like predicted oxidoreductase
VGEAVAPFRDRIVITTKFGFRIYPDGTPYGLDSRPDHIRQVTDAALSRSRVEAINFLYQHRMDPKVAIEDVAGAVKGLIDQSKLGIGFVPFIPLGAGFVVLVDLLKRIAERKHATPT